MRLLICIMDTVNSKISNQVICWTFWTRFVENVSWPLDETLNELFQFIFKQKDEEVIRIAKQLYSHWSVWPATTGCLPHANDCFQNTLSEQLASLLDEDSHSNSQCEVRALSIMRNIFVLIFMSISDCARGGFVFELCVGIARSAVNIRCKPGWYVLIFFIHIDVPHCSRFWRHPARRRSCMQSSTFKRSMRLQTTTCKDSRFSFYREILHCRLTRSFFQGYVNPANFSFIAERQKSGYRYNLYVWFCFLCLFSLDLIADRRDSCSVSRTVSPSANPWSWVT